MRRKKTLYVQVSPRMGIYYSNVVPEEDGWVCPEKWMPYPFDVVNLKAFSSILNRNKFFNGWWTGKDWEGLRLKNTDFVMAWKKPEEQRKQELP